MNYEKLDRKAVLSWRIGRLIGLFFLSVFIIIGLIFAGNVKQIEPYIKYAYLGAALLFIYKIIGLIVYPEIEYRQWRYVITEDKIELRHGLFFITTTVIPIVRVQHITISRGPVYRKLGLSKVRIFLASGSFEIEGLSENTANIISENLKSKVLERLNREQKFQ